MLLLAFLLLLQAEWSQGSYVFLREYMLVSIHGPFLQDKKTQCSLVTLQVQEGVELKSWSHFSDLMQTSLTCFHLRAPLEKR